MNEMHVSAAPRLSRNISQAPTVIFEYQLGHEFCCYVAPVLWQSASEFIATVSASSSLAEFLPLSHDAVALVCDAGEITELTGRLCVLSCTAAKFSDTHFSLAKTSSQQLVISFTIEQAENRPIQTRHPFAT